MKKFLFIPRAIKDLYSLWKDDLNVFEKSSLTYSLFLLKIKKWIFSSNHLIQIKIFNKTWYGANNEDFQFLLKEIFIKKVYACDIDNNAAIVIGDFGANIGLSSLFFSRNYPNAIIKAYEPNKSSFSLLQKNILLNRIKNIEIFQKAIAGTNKRMFPSDNFKDYSLNQVFINSYDYNKDDIEALSIINLIDLNQFDVIKLDIEGMEIEVLDAVIEQKRLTKIAYWMIEFHNNEKTEKYLDVFKTEGFENFVKESIFHFKLK